MGTLLSIAAVKVQLVDAQNVAQIKYSFAVFKIAKEYLSKPSHFLYPVFSTKLHIVEFFHSKRNTLIFFFNIISKFSSLKMFQIVFVTHCIFHVESLCCL